MARAASWLGRHKGKLLLGVGLLGCVAYFPVSIRLVERRVRGFCATVKPGDSADGTMMRGLAAGLRDLRWPQGKVGTASLYDSAGFYRVFCNVHHEGDRVTSTSTSAMD